MPITVNGRVHELPHDAWTIAALLEWLGYKDHFVAVAVNTDCVPRRLFAQHNLQAHDKIEILAPMAGG